MKRFYNSEVSKKIILSFLGISFSAIEKLTAGAGSKVNSGVIAEPYKEVEVF